jgi:hypothetical protein
MLLLMLARLNLGRFCSGAGSLLSPLANVLDG